MKRRTWKTVALLATGGVVLQLGGCGGGLGAVLIQNFVGLIVSAVLSAVLGSGSTTA
jgi:hypothetical protein